MAEDHSQPVFPTKRQPEPQAAAGRALGERNIAFMTGPFPAAETAFVAGHSLITSGDVGPSRFDPYAEEKKRGLHSELPGTPEAEKVLDQLHAGLMRSLEPLPPKDGSNSISMDDLAGLDAHLKAQGVTSIGYTEIPDHMIFDGKGIIGRAAIVLTMPMDAAALATSPSAEGFETVLATYASVGDAANAGADYLRQRGYTAQASHSLMGMALLPPLARKAGLGWLGESGMLITPEHGPGVRISAIFTTIKNLPLTDNDTHAWVGEYCRRCGNCARQCPSGAIMRDYVVRPDGSATTIDREKCFTFYVENYGCGTCLIACPFFRLGYEKVKRSYAKVLEREAGAG